MKRVLSILLVLILALALLPASALAADRVVLSSQNLRVDGKLITCEKYNINDSNYFKLRDIALLMNGTGSQFSVSWDGEKQAISIVTGEAYEPNGSELDLSGGDKSATAVPSSQKLIINGETRTDLSAYNIGGNNYFKLRDLGTALGFAVDYDPETNSAVVIGKQAAYKEGWLTIEYNSTSDFGSYYSCQTYSEEGYLLKNEYRDEYENGSSTSLEVNTYDALGRTIKSVYSSVYTSAVDSEESYTYSNTTTYEYNTFGLLAHTVSTGEGDTVDETIYVYDARGNLTEEDYISNWGGYTYLYFYDENDYLVKEEYWSEGELSTTYLYTRDADGNILVMKELDSAGNLYYCDESVYQNGLIVESKQYSDPENPMNHSYYRYDAQGNMVWTKNDYGETTYTYDAKGNPLTEVEVSNEGYVSTSTYTYNAAGKVVRAEYTYGGGDATVSEYTYNEKGDIVKEVYTSDYYSSETVYTYDYAARKMVVTSTSAYNGVG